MFNRGRAQDVVWQQVQDADDNLLHLGRDFRPSCRDLCINFLGELGHIDSSHSIFLPLRGTVCSAPYCAQLFNPPTHWHAEPYHLPVRGPSEAARCASRMTTRLPFPALDEPFHRLL